LQFEEQTMPYGAGDLDILSHAFYGALESVVPDERDPEEVKAIVMTGILDAARRGERDEDRLMASGLAALARYEDTKAVTSEPRL
jgi:hypothetical protein